MTVISNTPLYQNELNNLLNKKNYSIFSISEEFSIQNIRDPITIKDQINNQKENFKRLKLNYIEQQSQEKFLHRIAELDYDELGKFNDEFNKGLIKETNELKLQLKNLKLEMNEKVQELKDEVDKIKITYDSIQLKQNDLKSTIEEFEVIEKEFDDLIKEEKDQEFKDIIDHTLNIDTTIQLDSNIEISSSQMNSQLKENIETESRDIVQLYNTRETELNNLQSKVESLQNEIKEKENLLTQLRINSGEILDPQNKKINNYVLWCEDMIKILTKMNQ
ncbi:uncharacterized protein KGF55_003707 [Candida pseudojiufengensis]|uniref:uncharacterized protein n=1 Tax=Candida pseudojiufengensis TaxID=497109 RepID=UPI002225500F|nr:uncharacterized protein KGF55_003707 [Candida pseudojiufengensis]KAI5962631.1 hypothetical protein KGF55_003707 [Candida pseudojiufengensis]